MSCDIAYMDVKNKQNKTKTNKGGIGWVRKVTTVVVALKCSGNSDAVVWWQAGRQAA